MDRADREIILKYKTLISGGSILEKIKSLVKEYKFFTKLMFDDIFESSGERDFCDELCTRGPNAFSNFTEILEKSGYFDLAETLKKERSERHYPTSYKMDSDPLGYCLIIMNQKFEEPLDFREGCEADAKALENLFKNVLNFDVEVKWNRTAAEMKDILEQFSKKQEFKNVDCCVVYILSHGDQSDNLDFLYGTDCKKVYKKDIFAMFNNHNCQLLIGKPKIFFFQACRGIRLDKEMITISCKKDVHDNTCSNVKKINSQDSVDCPSPQINMTVVSEQSWPILSDMFIVNSTLLYYRSWKNNFTGSWLCQDLVSVIPKYFHKHHLSEMMTIVTDKQKNRKSEDGYKQITECLQPGVCGLIYFNRSKKSKKS